ncbi:hypothetical protein GW17_00057587, partial [Ensete ventricosum]
VTSTRTARYRAVPPKIDRRQSISAVGRPIEEEIDHRRSIEEEKGKKKRKRRKKEEEKKEYLARAPSLPTGRPRPRSLFSRARRRSVSPCGEKDRGDIIEIIMHLLCNDLIDFMCSNITVMCIHVATKKLQTDELEWTLYRPEPVLASILPTPNLRMKPVVETSRAHRWDRQMLASICRSLLSSCLPP